MFTVSKKSSASIVKCNVECSLVATDLVCIILCILVTQMPLKVKIRISDTRGAMGVV